MQLTKLVGQATNERSKLVGPIINRSEKRVGVRFNKFLVDVAAKMVATKHQVKTFEFQPGDIIACYVDRTAERLLEPHHGDLTIVLVRSLNLVQVNNFVKVIIRKQQ